MTAALSENHLSKLATAVVVCFVSVVIMCGSEKFIRDFMLTAHRLHMTNGQYVYVVADQVPQQTFATPWVAGDEQDQTARLAFESVLQVSVVRRPIFTALHGMQTRSSDENSVCLFVCPSVRHSNDHLSTSTP